MDKRILHLLLLCLIAVGPLSLPARGVARPDIRVPGIFADPAKSGPGITAQRPESHPAQSVYGYDRAPAVHTYLYAENDPVNKVDPSGHNAITMDVFLGSSLSMNLRASFERNRAPIYKGAILAALTVAGTYAATAATEAIQIHDAEMTLAGAGTSVRNEIAKAAQILRTRMGNVTPKIVPIPMSVIPNVAQNVAMGQLTTPGPLTRVNLLTTVKNRYAATSGKGSAGPGMSWDEYPFASSLQGGRPAVVRPVPAQENWVQGGIIAAAYLIEKIKVGDSYTVVITP